MATRPDWRRVSKRHPCPVCTKPDWCTVSCDGAVALCQRVESSKRVGDAGWLHRLQAAPWRPARRRVRTVRLNGSNAVQRDLARQAASCAASVDPSRLAQLGHDLGLSVVSLNRLQIGWSSQHRAWSFPMTSPTGHVLGIRLRRPDGVKFAVKGSRDGLFIPDRAGDAPPASASEHTPLLIMEGPTDTAALLDMGFGNVLGRPSCMGGTRLLVELVKVREPCEVIVVADGGAPGRRGADTLASLLVAYVPVVRVIQPPDRVNDARAWLRLGGTRQDVERVIRAAPIRRLRIQSRQVVTHG